MGRFISSHHPGRRFASFKYALRGIYHATANEVNFRIQLSIVLVSMVAGVVYQLHLFEWLALVVVSGMLLSAELINTTIEEFIDHLIHDHHEGARIIKDLSAGYVLTTALCALAVYLIVFGPKIFP
ncbi:diacylglycerol kinase family protein [Patescibacteria group bacterium]|nr:diacylglycerol kinase family protein [Patescibacteria group bacterium]MBU1970405.1 diacylglycerol kinase family protein [Patescibacteria group bacterium]